MPKIFSKQEKELINQKLMEVGKELFSQYGLKKTSIDDIIRQVGIAKGSFYKFYNSKEELYFRVIEEEESFRDEILEDVITSETDAKQALLKVITQAFNQINDNPFYQRLYTGEDYQQLLLKLPPEFLQKHMESDEESAEKFVQYYQVNSNLINVDTSVVTGVFRAIFLLTLHKKEIGYDIYDDVMKIVFNSIAVGLTTRENE